MLGDEEWRWVGEGCWVRGEGCRMLGDDEWRWVGDGC